MKSNLAHATFVGIGLAVMTLLVAPTGAQAEDGPWRLRVGGAWVDPDLGYEMPNDDGRTVQSRSDDDVGLALNLEYMLSERLGLDFGAVAARPELTLSVDAVPSGRIAASDTLSTASYTVGLNAHLTPEGPVDVYVGPVGAYVTFGDMTFTAGPEDVLELESESDWALGLTLGADLRISDGPWSLGVAATYLDSDLVVNQRGEDEEVTIEFDPMIYTLRVGYRF